MKIAISDIHCRNANNFNVDNSTSSQLNKNDNKKTAQSIDESICCLKKKVA